MSGLGGFVDYSSEEESSGGEGVGERGLVGDSVAMSGIEEDGGVEEVSDMEVVQQAVEESRGALRGRGGGRGVQRGMVYRMAMGRGGRGGGGGRRGRGGRGRKGNEDLMRIAREIGPLGLPEDELSESTKAWKASHHTTLGGEVELREEEESEEESEEEGMEEGEEGGDGEVEEEEGGEGGGEGGEEEEEEEIDDPLASPSVAATMEGRGGERKKGRLMGDGWWEQKVGKGGKGDGEEEGEGFGKVSVWHSVRAVGELLHLSWEEGVGVVEGIGEEGGVGEGVMQVGGRRGGYVVDPRLRISSSGSVLCVQVGDDEKTRKVLGTVVEVWGPVKQPHYTVKLAGKKKREGVEEVVREEEVVGEEGVEESSSSSSSAAASAAASGGVEEFVGVAGKDEVLVGSKVFVVEQLEKRVPTGSVVFMQGTDASAKNDIEVPLEEQEFSDDEEEEKAKRRKRRERRRGGGGGESGAATSSAAVGTSSPSSSFSRGGGGRVGRRRRGRGGGRDSSHPPTSAPAPPPPSSLPFDLASLQHHWETHPQDAARHAQTLALAAKAAAEAAKKETE